MRVWKFALVGLVGLTLGEILLFMFTEFLGIFYVFSGVIAVEIVVIINFFMHERWTFMDREKKEKWIKRLWKYNVISLAGLALNTILLFVITEFFGIYYLASFIIAAFIVFNWNYLVNLKKTWRYDKNIEIPAVGRNPLVSIVIPTYNEKENVEILVPKIFEIFKRNGMKGEVIIVDDNSPDGTGKIAEKMKSKHRMKVIHREKKLGLSSAVLEGFRKAEGEIIGVMDADLSHSPENIPKLVRPIISNESDIAVASRHVEGGKVKDWPFSRRIISKVGTFMAKFLTNLKDPGSGFFFFKSSVIEGKELNPIGFKMGLEVLVKGEYSKIKEIPYTFVNREIGESKLDSKEYLKYIKHLIKLYWYKINK